MLPSSRMMSGDGELLIILFVYLYTFKCCDFASCIIMYGVNYFLQMIVTLILTKTIFLYNLINTV